MPRHRAVGPPRMPVARALHEQAHLRAEEFARDHVVERIWARDHSLWRPEPTEIADRLGWLDVDRDMAEHVGDLEGFARQVTAAGYTTAVVLGMGGSSLAPRVFATAFAGHTRGLDVLVLDSTVPAAVRAVEQRAASEQTLFIVSSKSGTTLETMALLDAFWAGHPNGQHFVAITDGGTPLETIARERDFRRVFLNRSDIGGRFSALSYVGLVPAALLGIDLARLLRGARDMSDACRESVSPLANPGAQLGILIAEAANLECDALTLRVDETLGAFGAWLEQLIAESTGKECAGILPVIDEPLGAPEVYDDSRFFMAIGEPEELRALCALSDGGRLPVASYTPGDAYRLGAEFFRWEFATAVAGRILGINPFDQPDVEASKQATARLLAGGDSATSASAPIEDLLGRLANADPMIDGAEYLAIHAYLPRAHATDRRLRQIRARLRDRFRLPTTVEYGPSLLHSTGQYHKGGRRRGAIVQVTDPVAFGEPLLIPNRDYDFGTLARAQAAGDRAALEARGRIVALATVEHLEALA